jgi:hypothetical protein
MSDPSAVRCGRVRYSRFRQEESGAGSAFGLFGILICLIFAGLSIDFTNAWRHREILRLSADVAAHAGASTLAEGGTRMAALAVSTGAVELNTPLRSYGRTIYDPFESIQALKFDPVTNLIGPGEVPNAVSVQLQRSTRVQNPVPTFLLRLIGRKSWDISVTSVAAVVPTERCSNGDGLYSHSAIATGSQVSLGKGVCIHGQKGVDVPGQSSFDSGAVLSMPDMADCRSGCSDLSSAGFAAAATEVNLVMTPPAALIARLSTAFSDNKRQLPEEKLFFDLHPLAEDLSALDELGVDTGELKTGDVIVLTPEQVTRARQLPAGLVYRVGCAGESGEGSILSLGGFPVAAEVAGAEDELIEGEFDNGGALAEQQVDGGEGDGELFLAEAQQLDGIVLVADCRVHFTALANIQGSIILSTTTAPGTSVTADVGASAGDPERTCTASKQSVIMALGDLELPADFAASNVAFVTGGAARVGGTPAGTAAPHRGLAIHAQGTVTLSGKHVFSTCDTAPSALLPALNIIKLVIPTEPLK